MSYLYTIKRPSTLRENQVKQISLFEPADVKKVKKNYTFNFSKWQNKVDVTLSFENTKSINLEIPLPKGLIRVYKAGKSGDLEFIGEDRIDHTPQKEKVEISTGKAFDIVGERNITDSKKNEQSVEIKIRNRKKETVEIKVVENLGRREWEIIEATSGWKKTSHRTIEWIVKVKPDEETVVWYTVLFKKR